ncbi:MAG: nucleotidyltransferase family protein [Candidatus Dormibacteraeota bacterium]|nr:nucleotidyltransferase family protein [Candidatus Dormibacteraeota bacterium]
MTSAGVVLAAGTSSRMGSPKQLLDVGGRPMLERIVAAACASRLDDIVVVLGADADRIRRLVDLGRARAVINAQYMQGMSTSLRAGVAALSDDIDRVVVVLGDQPDVDASLIDALLIVQEASGLPAAALDFDGLLHPPVVLARDLWPRIDELRGDVGLRQLLRRDPDSVARVAAASPAGHPVDIDTPRDAAELIGDG